LLFELTFWRINSAVGSMEEWKDGRLRTDD
jgi:hypothetical protein